MTRTATTVAVATKIMMFSQTPITNKEKTCYLVGGLNPSEKYEFVSWDDDIPNIWKVIKVMFQATNRSPTSYVSKTGCHVYRPPVITSFIGGM